MENIFTLPRSGESHPDNKNLVGSYILQKFIRQGLMTAEQTFHHEIKLNALARMKRLPRVVCNVLYSLAYWPQKSKNQITYVRSFELSFCVNAVITILIPKLLAVKDFLTLNYVGATLRLEVEWWRCGTFVVCSKVTSDSRIRSSTINDCWAQLFQYKFWY